MRALRALLLLAILVPACSGCEGPQVTQGSVVRHDRTNQSLVVKDERTSEQIEFATWEAEIGADLAEGDLVRVAWREGGGWRAAIRVMNVSRQEEAQNLSISPARKALAK